MRVGAASKDDASFVTQGDQDDVSILVLGTADWDQSIATNQHYAVRELAADYDVTFVESMGLRRPTFSRRDIARAVRRLRRVAGTVGHESWREIPSRVTVASPMTVPVHHWPFTAVNRAGLAWSVRRWRRSGELRVLWAYTPTTYGLERYADFVVYHCVDLLGSFPGVDQVVVERAETRLARRCDVAGASSEAVAEHLRAAGFQTVRNWPNVADVEKFIGFPGSASLREERSAAFAGNLNSKKVDFAAMHLVLDAGYRLHLAGPISEGGGNDRLLVRELVERGAVHHGLLGPDDLAQLLRKCTIGLIPYLDTPYTRGVSPLKTFEYLAAGLHVVSLGVPSVESRPRHVDVLDTRDELVQVLSRIEVAPSAEDVGAREAIALQHSWATRGREMRAVVKGSKPRDAV